MKPGERHPEPLDVGAVETRHAEQNLDAVQKHIVGQRVPQQEHRRAAALPRLDAGTAKLEQPAPRRPQQRQVVLGIAVVPPEAVGLVRSEQPVGADHIVEPARIAAAIDEDEVIVHAVELVALEPAGVIDHRPVTAQLLDEDPIAQPLRGQEILLGLGQSDAEGRGIGRHGHRSSVPRGFYVARDINATETPRPPRR